MMPRTLIRISMLSCILIFCSAFTFKPKVDKLPNSSHPLWDEFAKCRFVRDEVRNLTMVGYTLEVRRLNNKEITISGFMVPLETGKKIRHVLLNRINPTCAFCPPNKPSDVVEVFASEELSWDENLATFSGRLELVNDGRQRIFFLLKDAVRK
jgi:hypothetical protein